MDIKKETTLEKLNKVQVPPFPEHIPCIGQKEYDRHTRIKCYVETLREYAPVGSAEEALYLVNSCIELVEDLYSGQKREPIPPAMRTSRMYPALDDNIEKLPDGGYTVRTRGNKIEIDKNGGFSIYDRKTNELWLTKNGI